MLLNVLRGLFVLLMAAIGWAFLSLSWLNLAFTVSFAVIFVAIDILSPRKKLVSYSAIVLGLVTGLAIAFVLHFVTNLLVDLSDSFPRVRLDTPGKAAMKMELTLVVSLVCCYLSVSFVLQTKDDVRFIIPYVEFTKKIKGTRPLLLDTSALIDGRIGDVVATGIIDSQLLVPRFVLLELQNVSDSGDKLKRNRGRRGLDVLTNCAILLRLR